MKRLKGRMRLLFFTQKYPGKHNTTDYIFVKQLVDAMAGLGHECHVVAPYNILHYMKYSPKYEVYQIGSGSVTIYRPYYLSFSDFKVFKKIAFASKRNAIRKAISRLPEGIDVAYGHFWRSAYEGYDYARNHNIPLFVATGESNISDSFPSKPDITAFREYVRGVICVSTKNRDESISNGLTEDSKCVVLPNAVDNKLFRRLSRQECRKTLRISQSFFVVAYVGWFIERKGVLRVSEAISRAKGAKVYSLFIGDGEQTPKCNGILFKGKVTHEKLPLLLNAADVFVLPTRQEGCCNAIVEAMACGLPIISSDLPFNWDILDDSNSLLIDPNSIEDISTAIMTLRDDVIMRERLGEGSLKKASELTITKRAESIVHFIKNSI